MKPKPTHADLAGSRYLALQRLARAQKRTTAELIQLYVMESFLRRLVRSRHDDSLVLKGFPELDGPGAPPRPPESAPSFRSELTLVSAGYEL